MARYANLFVDQGSDFQTSVSLENVKGDFLDTEPLEFNGQVRRTPGSDEGFDFEILKSNTENGVITLRLSRQVTESMGAGRYVYDVVATDSGFDNRFKVLQGILEVIPQVTRV